MARDQRRLAAIVSADVAGNHGSWVRMTARTFAALEVHRRELTDPKIAEYDGRIVKTTGDGLLLEFPSVVARACAARSTCSEGWPSARRRANRAAHRIDEDSRALPRKLLLGRICFSCTP